MFKTYRFIPIVFILFLFGFTLITVSPVFAGDSPDFIACQQSPSLKEKKNCFRDLARTRGDVIQLWSAQCVSAGLTKFCDQGDAPKPPTKQGSADEMADRYCFGVFGPPEANPTTGKVVDLTCKSSYEAGWLGLDCSTDSLLGSANPACKY